MLSDFGRKIFRLGVFGVLLVGCSGQSSHVTYAAFAPPERTALQSHGRAGSVYPTDRSLIFEADQSQNAVNIYSTRDAAKNVAPIAQIATGGGPFGMALDKYGTLYVAQYGGWSVSEYAKGATTARAIITDGIQEPLGVAVDKHGTLFVSNNAGWISVYPNGSTSPSEKITGGGMSHPFGLALDKDGNLFIADFVVQKIFELPAGSQTLNELELQDLSGPTGIAIDQRSGYMWVTAVNRIYVYPPNSQSPSEEIDGFKDAYALSIQEDGSLQGEAVLADPNANLIYAFKRGRYKAFTSFDNGMSSPTGVLIGQP